MVERCPNCNEEVKSMELKEDWKTVMCPFCKKKWNFEELSKLLRENSKRD